MGIGCLEKSSLIHSSPGNKLDYTIPFEVETSLILGAHTEKEGVGGVKMEDHAFVTETGLEVYSTFPRGTFADAAMEGYE